MTCDYSFCFLCSKYYDTFVNWIEILYAKCDFSEDVCENCFKELEYEKLILTKNDKHYMNQETYDIIIYNYRTDKEELCPFRCKKNQWQH